MFPSDVGSIFQWINVTPFVSLNFIGDLKNWSISYERIDDAYGIKSAPFN